jgi:hypothetical protein
MATKMQFGKLSLAGAAKLKSWRTRDVQGRCV